MPPFKKYSSDIVANGNKCCDITYVPIAITVITSQLGISYGLSQFFSNQPNIIHIHGGRYGHKGYDRNNFADLWTLQTLLF